MSQKKGIFYQHLKLEPRGLFRALLLCFWKNKKNYPGGYNQNNYETRVKQGIINAQIIEASLPAWDIIYLLIFLNLSRVQHGNNK